MAFEEVDFVLRQPLRLPQPGHHGAARRADALRHTDAGRRALPRPIQVVLGIETLDRLVEVAHEAGAAQLAVGKDLEPGPLLTIEDVEDVPILDASQLVMRDIRVLARLEQFRRPQQTANLVRAIDGSHTVTSSGSKSKSSSPYAGRFSRVALEKLSLLGVVGTDFWL